MQIKSLGAAIDLTTVAAGTAVEFTETPFLPGRECLIFIGTNALAGATAALKIQGSADNTNWTDLVTVTGVKPDSFSQVTCYAYMRTNVTVAGSGGKGNVIAIAGI